MLPFPTQGGRLSAAYASWHLYLQQQQNNPKKHVSFTGPRYPRRETSRDASSRHIGCSISPSCPAPCVHDNHTPRPPTRGCSARPGQGCRRRCGDGTGRRNRLPVRDGAPAPSRAGPPSSHPQPPGYNSTEHVGETLNDLTIRGRRQMPKRKKKNPGLIILFSTDGFRHDGQ